MNINHYKVSKEIKLNQVATSEVDVKAKQKLKKVRKKISELQDVMYAHGKYSMLICLQGMDTSGKDSLIREVFKNVNARGVVVHSFKVPTENELKHDFLWRHYIALPERGKIGVFNRTHYENVLVTRVHPEYILGEQIPSIKNLDDVNDDFFQKRMEHINNFERHISENGTIILKFFLHLSKEEQKNRLLRRLNFTDKNWKFSSGDLKERKLWNQYQTYYEEAIHKTSTKNAPWFIVPADDKETARFIVARAILESLESYEDIKYPELEKTTTAQLKEFKNELEND